MQIKKRYVVIVVLLLLGLTTFTFANPSQSEKQKSSKGISEKVSNDKQENKSYAEALDAVEKAEENPTLETVETARTEIQNADDATAEQINQLEQRVEVVEETIDVAALVKEVETLAEVKETRETAREKYPNAETEVNKLDEGEVKNNLTKRLEKVLRLLNDTTAPEITGVTNGSIVNKSENIYVSDEFLYNVKITGPNSKGEIVTKEFNTEDFANENNDAYTMKYKANYEGKWTVVATDKVGNTKTETFTIDKTAAKKNAVNANVNGYKNDVKEQYATNGNTVTAYISINEELKYNPTFTFYANGKEIKVIAKEDVVARQSSNANYPYVYEVKLAIDETLEAEDGELTFTVTDIVDKAGNKTTDITKVSNGKVVKLDRTSPVRKSTDFYVSGLTQLDKTFYTQYGNKVVVNITTDEELGELPVFTLHNNGNDYVMTDVLDRGLNDKGYYLYQASLVITKEAGFKDGYVTFTVSNIKDKAGNNSDDVTDATNGRQVALDNKNPVIAGVNNNYNYKAPITITAVDYIIHNLAPIVSATIDEEPYEMGTKYEKEGVHKLVVYDAAGNRTRATFTIDMTAPTLRFTKAGSSLVVDEISPIVIDGVNYFNQDVRVTISDNINLRLHGIDTYDDDNNPNRTGWLKDVRTVGKHTVIGVDSTGNKTEFEFILAKNTLSINEDNTGSIDGDITLIDETFYNDIKTEKPVTINGNGKTVTQYITSSDKLTWQPNNLYGETDPTSKNIPVLGNVFSSLKGAKVTVNDITFAGTHHSIMLGNYEDSSSNWFNTEFNNVNIINTNVVSLSANIAPAAVIYGNATLNNVNIYGTKRSELEVADDDRWPFWPVYDLAAVNSSNTTINGGKIGSIYLWAKAVMTINNAEIDTIDTLTTSGHLEIGAGTTVNRINMNGNNAYKPDVTIKAGATVKVLDLSKVTNFTDIIIEAGATVETVITKDGEMSYDEWLESSTPIGQLKLAAKNGGTYKLTADMALNDVLTIAEGKELIIDLNDHELKLDNKEESAARLIQNAGKLTIKNGTLTNEDIKVNGVIDNNGGELTIEKITIKDSGSNSSSTIYNENGKLTITDSDIIIVSQDTGCRDDGEKCGNTAVENRGDLVIKNTKITSDSGDRYAVTTHSGNVEVDNVEINIPRRGGFAITGGNVDVKNTTILKSYYYTFYLINSLPTNLTIHNGNYSSSRSIIYMGKESATNKATTTVKGGTFNTLVAKRTVVTIAEPSEGQEFGLTITGGTFKGSKNDVSAYVAEGYEQNSKGVVVAK